MKLSVEDLTAHYVTESYGIVKRVYALESVTFQIGEEEFLAIVGESGCGKTTLARIVYGAVTPQLHIVNGSVRYFFGGTTYEISSRQNSVKNLWWKKVSYIPQGSLNVLNPMRRVRDIVKDLETSHGIEIPEEKIKQHLETLKLPSHVLNMYPFELSGGMRQRVVIALATILQPELIIADEPTSALDVVVQYEILQLLKEIQSQRRCSFIFITHDISLIPNLADTLMIMYGGHLVEYGRCKEVLSNPQHPYTRFLISSIPRIGDKREKASIPGYPPDLTNPPPGCRFHPRCPYVKEECLSENPPVLEVGPKHYVKCWLFG